MTYLLVGLFSFLTSIFYNMYKEGKDNKKENSIKLNKTTVSNIKITRLNTNKTKPRIIKRNTKLQ